VLNDVDVRNHGYYQSYYRYEPYEESKNGIEKS
jgi:hypothetical protein